MRRKVGKAFYLVPVNRNASNEVVLEFRGLCHGKHALVQTGHTCASALSQNLARDKGSVSTPGVRRASFLTRVPPVTF